MRAVAAYLCLALAAATDRGFVPVPVNDPFLDESTDAFLRDYRLKLTFHFANVSESRIIGAEVARFPLPVLNELPMSDNANTTMDYVEASTYRVNMLMNIHFNSEKFGGNDFVTVASAEYTCFNRTNDHETCEADSFLENKRVAQPIADVPEYIRPSIDLATHDQYADEEPVWTAYETQELSVAGHMDYVKFVLDGEPVPCTAAFHYDGVKARMVHLDWSCYSATYVETKMRSMIRNGYIKLVATALSILALFAAITVYCKRRAVGGSHILRFLAPAAPPVQEKPRPTEEPPKSYSSFRV